MPFGNQTFGAAVDHDYMARMLKTVKEAGADGVIIWGSTLLAPNDYQSRSNAGWWTALKEFAGSLGANGASTPNTPILIDPANGTTIQPPSFVSQWSASSGAICYNFQVSDNATFQNPLINDSTITDTLQQVGGAKQYSVLLSCTSERRILLERL